MDSGLDKKSTLVVSLVLFQVVAGSAVWILMRGPEREADSVTETGSQDAGSKKALPEKQRYRGNRLMARWLTQVREEQVPRIVNSLQCSLSVGYCRELMKRATTPAHKLGLHYVLADNLLHSGKTEEAINEFTQLIEIRKNTETRPDEWAKLHDRLGISYLRLGEQANCIHHHNTESCLFPLKGGGIHWDRNGAEMAVEEYLAALEIQPDRLNHRWLLNIAYMALGKYPDEVPEKWLIPPKCFESDYDIGRFVDVAPAVGLDALGCSGSCVVDDFNNDGYLDVVASSSGLSEPLRFFVNKADGTFEERTEEAQLTGLTGGLNLCHGDYNNDGYVDVYVIRGAWTEAPQPFPPSSLLRNNGDGTFEDVTEEARLLRPAPGLSASWADFDNDGWLDLFVGNESRGEQVKPVCLYRNNRDGTFTECARQVGIDLVTFVRGVAWGTVTSKSEGGRAWGR
ncbi:MAG: VCBS repeat-containing protein [Planctomycetota bacterium]|nr:VCBS repeat-containing protein [Planctomycetota bacterium]